MDTDSKMLTYSSEVTIYTNHCQWQD